jgi:hypothetical protein
MLGIAYAQRSLKGATCGSESGNLPHRSPAVWLTPLAARQAVAPRWGYDYVVVFYLPVFPDQASIALGSRPVGLRTFERHPPPGGLCRPHGLRFADFSASLPSALVWPSPRMIKPRTHAPFAPDPSGLDQLFSSAWFSPHFGWPGRCYAAVTAVFRARPLGLGSGFRFRI